MKKILGTFALFSLLLLTACTSVEDDLTTYVDDTLPPLFKTESKVIDKYDSVIGNNYINDSVLYATLVSEVIPQYNDFIDDLENAEIETDEVQKVHDNFIKAAKTQEEGFEILKTAIENQDSMKVEKANQKINEARTIVETYRDELNKLADEQDVDLTKVQ
jgi:vacuolar-type H+-ATPase subunit I/STV1